MNCGKLCLRQALPCPTAGGTPADLGAPPPYQAAPLEASPGSPRPRGHQVSTYLLSESRSWPGTPSPEPQRFPVILRATAKAAQGACSSGPRRGARHTPDTLPRALAHSDRSRCGKQRGPRGSAPRIRRNRPAEVSAKGAARDAGQPPHARPRRQSRPRARPRPCPQRLEHRGTWRIFL